MSKIYSLSIKHFRGIESFEQCFGDNNFIVLLGRGDSGKSTILKAISVVLSPMWNVNFTDFDFKDGDTSVPIEIEATISDFPRELSSDSKYGLYLRFLRDGEIHDYISNKIDENERSLITVKLTVDSSLEPKWTVTNKRDGQEDRDISCPDRSKFNMYTVSDYIDSQFTYRKGSPLYSLLKESQYNTQSLDQSLLDIIRKVYEEISNTNSFTELDQITQAIDAAAKDLGLDISNLKTQLEFKGNTYTESSISLHENGIPYHLHGKGSKRLLSIALQKELTKQGGIIVIDELEQGLEPDRSRNLTNIFKKSTQSQVFISTHSRDVLVESDANNIFLMRKGANNLFHFNEEFQGVLRANPEAFFAKKIISCEGATEVGIIRAIDEWLHKNKDCSFARLGVYPIDAGGGNKFYKYAINFNKVGFQTLVFCDDDNRDIDNDKKDAEKQKQIMAICESGKSIEEQLFKDLPRDAVIELIQLAEKEHPSQNIYEGTEFKNIAEIRESSKDSFRTIFGQKAKGKKNSWYKSINNGEAVGFIIMKYIDSLNKESILYKELMTIMNWVK